MAELLCGVAEQIVVSASDQLTWELSVSADGEQWSRQGDRIEG